MQTNVKNSSNTTELVSRNLINTNDKVALLGKRMRTSSLVFGSCDMHDDDLNESVGVPFTPVCTRRKSSMLLSEYSPAAKTINAVDSEISYGALCHNSQSDNSDPIHKASLVYNAD